MKKYSMKHIGKEHTTMEGYIAKVVDGGNKPGRCMVELEGVIFDAEYSSIKKGILRNRNKPTVLGVGYIGYGNYKSSIKGKHTQAYRIWKGMFKRCYDKKEHIKNPCYIGCVVDEEWHNFQNFAEWFDENYIEGFELDKDMQMDKNKRYSPEVCMFIPNWLNTFYANKKSDNTTGYIGVSPIRNKFVANIRDVLTNKQIYLVTFNSAEEAGIAYDNYRSINVLNAKKKAYKEGLPKKIIYAIH